MEILDPAPGPDNVRRVAAGGEREACLTSVTHYLGAWTGIESLPARFATVVVRRSPMAALVDGASEFHRSSDLAGLRLAAPPGNRLVAEFRAALESLGVAPLVEVPVDYLEAPGALARGKVDAIADFTDLLPRTRRLAGGMAVRAVPVGLDIYASGLVVSDQMPAAVALRLRDAVVAALELQRREPTAGIAELCRRYPEVSPDEALEGWALVEPNVFTEAGPGTMDERRWEATIAFTASAQDLPAPPAAAVYRPELAAGAAAPA